ncbi:MAG: Gfo/Idh/MocA family oxidoreductase, partial [Christensenellaceae bacterium]|nr:Gfo/Idh/MocA family oxidoreductase [Christensenellaceae bacterium]
MSTAIFGSGTIANVHLNALRFLGKEVSIVIDKFPETGKSFAEKWGIKQFSTNPMDAMNSDVDTIHICTPPNLHYETAKLALEHNKNVICEKPFCISSSQAIELYNLAKNKKLVNAVNFNVRYNPACIDAKNHIQNKKLGDVLLIHGSYLQEFHVLPTEYSWRYQPEFGGNMRAVTEIASHWIDLARYISGLEVTEVSANFAYFNKHRLLKDNIMYPSSM